MDDFPEKYGTAKIPAATRLFDIDDSAEKLSKQKSEVFHQFVARILWRALRVPPDLLTDLLF